MHDPYTIAIDLELLQPLKPYMCFIVLMMRNEIVRKNHGFKAERQAAGACAHIAELNFFSHCLQVGLTQVLTKTSTTEAFIVLESETHSI